MILFRAVVRLCLFMGITALMIVPHLIVMLFTRGAAAEILPMIWYRIVCRIFAIRIHIHGTPVQTRPVMYVSNHISYLDIPVIGTVIRGCFIAKSEVANWPLFGFLSKCAQTIYVKRNARDALQDNQKISEAIMNNKNIIIFPEGTSSTGENVLKFKSTLFSVIFLDPDVRQRILIQPFTVKIEKINGRHISDDLSLRDQYAWYGDMTLAPHLWELAKSESTDISLFFHPPRNAVDFECRKTLAKDCEIEVAKPLSSDITLAA